MSASVENMVGLLQQAGVSDVAARDLLHQITEVLLQSLPPSALVPDGQPSKAKPIWSDYPSGMTPASVARFAGQDETKIQAALAYRRRTPVLEAASTAAHAAKTKDGLPNGEAEMKVILGGLSGPGRALFWGECQKHGMGQHLECLKAAKARGAGSWQLDSEIVWIERRIQYAKDKIDQAAAGILRSPWQRTCNVEVFICMEAALDCIRKARGELNSIFVQARMDIEALHQAEKKRLIDFAIAILQGNVDLDKNLHWGAHGPDKPPSGKKYSWPPWKAWIESGCDNRLFEELGYDY